MTYIILVSKVEFSKHHMISIQQGEKKQIKNFEMHAPKCMLLLPKPIALSDRIIS